MIYLFCDYFVQKQLSKKLKQSPDTFDDLKSVLGTISAIKNMSLEVEMRITDIQEQYRTLAMYKVEVLCLFTERVCDQFVCLLAVYATHF